MIWKGRKRTDAKGQGSQYRIVDVEVKMSIAASPATQDTVVGILHGIAGLKGAEGGPDLHAAQDVIDAELVLPTHPLKGRSHVILLAHAFFGPLDGNPMIGSVGVHPTPIAVGALPQGLLRDGPDAVDVPEKVDNVFLAGQQRQISQDDHSVETVIYKGQQAAKELVKGFHRSAPVIRFSLNKSSVRRPVEIKISNIFG